MSEHEDEKAGRILYSFAFITAATSATFAAFSSANVRFFHYGIEWISFTFLMYIFFLLIGTFLLLYALGPRYYRATITSRRSQDINAPQSLFFFETIAEENDEKWQSYFRLPIDSIMEKACNDFVLESLVISRKILTKIKAIRYAKMCFVISMVMLVCMVILGITSYLN